MILFLFIHPAPYNSLFYERCINSSRAKVVFYDPLDYGHAEWGLPFDKLKSFFLPKSTILRYISLLYLVFSAKSIVVPGYSRPESFIAIFLSRLLLKKCVLACDSTKPSRLFPTSLLRKLFQGFWSSSFSTLRFLMSNEIDKDIIFSGCYTITGSSFLPIQPSSSTILTLRLPTSYLFVGKLIPSRQILVTISSFYDLNIPGSTLFVVGDGPDFASAEKLVEANSQKSCTVNLLGNLPFKQIFDLYISCSNYIHFGSEPYSTALELAALYGLNIAASLDCGYIHDLIHFGGEPVLVTNSSRSLVDSLQRLSCISAYSSFSTNNCLSAHRRRAHSLSEFSRLNTFLNS